MCLFLFVAEYAFEDDQPDSSSSDSDWDRFDDVCFDEDPNN